MASLPGFEYDIFISYRHNDNLARQAGRSGWVTDFVKSLQEELAATIKTPVSVYFDSNPHDGLLETHSVDKSLERKLKCLIFIPILSQTYCDPTSFAWQHEFCAFNALAKGDPFGRDILLANGNVASRILPVKIHELDPDDKALLEQELGGAIRGLEFIYREPGVNRPLSAGDENPNGPQYRNQINKVSNAVKDILNSLKKFEGLKDQSSPKPQPTLARKKRLTKSLLANTSIMLLVLLLIGYLIFNFSDIGASPGEKSIAVLPFKNFSTNEETQYFADGVMEAVLNHLSKIKNLKVISRTSMEVYRKSPKSVKEIASELDVNHILEGSVQREGNTVRITVQLINATHDQHVWADSYDRELNGVFAIESEIAENIAKKLKAAMNPEEQKLIEDTRVYNLAAYDEYLKGRQKSVAYLIHRRKTDLEEAINFYRGAIGLDSTMAPAFAEWADAFAQYTDDRDFLKESYLDTAMTLCNKALAIDSTLANAHRLKGLFYYLKSTDFEQALMELDEAIRLAPNNADNYITKGQINMYWHQEQSLENFLIGLQLDPNSTSRTIIYSDISQIYVNVSEASKYELYARKALEIEPSYGDAHWCLVHGNMVQGKLKEALAYSQDWLTVSNRALRYIPEIYTSLGEYERAEPYFKRLAKERPFDVDYNQRYGVLLWKLGDKEKARQKLETCLKDFELVIKLKRPFGLAIRYDMAGINSFLGRSDEARKWLRTWEEYGLIVGLDRYALFDPLFENLWNDAEFKGIVQRLQDKNTLLAKKLKEIEKKNVFN